MDYDLEDRAMKGLPQLFKERYSIEVQGRLVRRFVKYNGKYDEINIFGEGIRDKGRLYIIGDRFLFMVTYSARPEAEEYARDKGVEVIWSFEI